MGNTDLWEGACINATELSGQRCVEE